MISAPLYRTEIIRQLRNPYTLAFSIAMPVVLFLMFGADGVSAQTPFGQANISFYVMVSMAAFGAATSMVSLTSLAASEVQQGWGRQLGLTPLSSAKYASTKVAAALTFSAVSVAAVYIAGAVIGATPDSPMLWVSTGLLILGVGLIYGLYGTGVGLIFPSDSAAALASISITFFGFFGNVFIPLSGVMLDIARFTPLYGYAAIVRWPFLEGQLVAGGSDPLWVILANVGGWTAVFAVLVFFGVRASKRRR